jgi:uncharacterized membrane protein YfcA
VAIAAGGGIGGGGLLVPIYVFLMQFSPKRAIALSSVTIFGGGIANTALNSYHKHPVGYVFGAGDVVSRPLIDYTLALVMEPMTISGAVVGTIVNKLLPGWVLSVALFIVLAATCYTTFGKWRKMRATEELQVRAASVAQANDMREATEGTHGTTSAKEPLLGRQSSLSAMQSVTILQQLKRHDSASEWGTSNSNR